MPKFLTAFISGRKLSKQQAEELKRLIDEYKEIYTKCKKHLLLV